MHYAVRCAAKMGEAYSTTSFDLLSVGQQPPSTSPSKPETEVNSAMTSEKGGRRRRRGERTGRGGSRRQRRQAADTSAAQSTSFVGLMQQLSVDGRELFELAERGHFDAVVDSTATKDVSGGPVTFTSPESYLALSADTQAPSFSIYFRVPVIDHSFPHSLREVFIVVSQKPNVRTAPNSLSALPGRGSVLLWRRCNTLCASGVVDDVIFSHNEPYGGLTLRQQLVAVFCTG